MPNEEPSAIGDDVTIRGFTVVRGEVERMLLQHPAVAEAVVVGRADPSAVRRLVAFVVADPGATLRSRDLQQFLKERLAEPMVPSVFVELDALPRQPDGTTDWPSLMAFEESHVLLQTEYVPPATPVERMIAEVWADLFELEQVGTRDDFFELGGDSLKAMEMCFQIHQKSGVTLELHRIFAAPTIADLARCVATLTSTTPSEV